MIPATPGSTRVLIVDDHPQSRDLLRAALAGLNYQVLEAADGPEALARLESIQPEVVLLDAGMSGMSGYEVCRAIRAEKRTERTSLILVSACTDHAALNEGFAAGAVDFISKPVRPEELCARVAVHAELSRARRELEESHARLAALHQEKDLMFGMAAHDMRGPISVIMGFAENTLAQIDEGNAAHGAMEVVLREAEQMEYFLGTLLDLEALEKGGRVLDTRVIDLAQAAREAIRRATPAALRKSILLHGTPVEGRFQVRADRHAVRRVLDNLISNALKFTPAGGRVTVRLIEQNEEVHFLVFDTGPGLTASDLTRVFTRFARLSARPTAGEKSTGLGLAICRALMAGMGGRVWCGNNPEGGAHFGLAFGAAPRGRDQAGAPERNRRAASLSECSFPHLLADRAL